MSPFGRGESMIRLPFLSASIFIALTAGALSQDQSGPKAVSPATRGQRVFTCGHSFHGFVYRMVGEMAKSAGIKDHQFAGSSMIGGSRVIQHWDVPETKNQAKAALIAGKVDVLTL